MVGISEYKYGVPITYKILLSQNTRKVKSKIFKSPFKLALQGDFEKGVECLYCFLEELKKRGYFDEEEIDESIRETKRFLESHTGYECFHLEGAEVYESIPFIGNGKELRKIQNIEKEKALFYQIMDEEKSEYDSKYEDMSEEERNTEKGKEKLQRIKDRMMRYIGIHEWTDCLYYEISKN